MDDTRLGSGTHLITSQKANKELSVLQAIIDNGTCDVSTQTVNRSVTQLTADDKQYQEVNLKGILYRPSSRSKKSSFRLFIVPDDSGNSDMFHDSNLRTSLDQELNSQSLRLSITSNECGIENESTELLRNSKDIKTDQRRRNTFKRSERTRKDTVLSVGLKKGNSDATIDHNLMHSTNPSVLAWLKVKNFEEREKRRRKKQEKKELRRHAYEEAEKRQKRIEESEKQFAQWLIAKKKEARCVWKAARARKRVTVVENESTVRKDNDPPPNYTAVPTFNGTQALVRGDVSLHIGSISNSTNRKSTFDNELETGSIYKHQNDTTTESSQLIQTTTQEQSTNVIILENNHESDQYRLYEDNNNHNHNERPVTANSRLLSVNGINSKFSSRKTQEQWPDKKSKYKRPSTSGGRLTRNANTMGNKEIKAEITYEAWMVQKRKEQKSKRPSTHASDPNHKDSKKPIKKSITFEAWKAQKRLEIKENAKLKKREIVDDALTEAILKMGKKRVENLCKEKRRLDTGMPKWQARNRVDLVPEKNASNSSAFHSRCTVIPLLGNEHDNHGTPKTGTQAKEVSAIRKSCENLKLD